MASSSIGDELTTPARTLHIGLRIEELNDFGFRGECSNLLTNVVVTVNYINDPILSLRIGSCPTYSLFS